MYNLAGRDGGIFFTVFISFAYFTAGDCEGKKSSYVLLKTLKKFYR